MNHYCTSIVVCMLLLTTVTRGQPPDADVIEWQEGPSIGDLGDFAEVRIPAGYIFAGADDTRHLMEAMENPTHGTEVGFVAPADMDWFVVFEFDAIGYVRDDEKGALDADAILKALVQGNEIANQERTRRGWAPVTILGWEQEPHYNQITHNLEWALQAESEGGLVVNHNTRLLGRKGVMRVTLVAYNTPQNLDQGLRWIRCLNGKGIQETNDGEQA